MIEVDTLHLRHRTVTEGGKVTETFFYFRAKSIYSQHAGFYAPGSIESAVMAVFYHLDRGPGLVSLK